MKRAKVEIFSTDADATPAGAAARALGGSKGVEAGGRGVAGRRKKPLAAVGAEVAAAAAASGRGQGDGDRSTQQGQ